jgi:two-component system, LytTR family, sensor kinase
MKRSVVIVLHIGYWFLYAVLLLVILFSLRVGAKPGSPAPFGMGTYIFLSVFALVPAAIGFYAFYSTLFTRFLAKKRLLFFLYAAIVSAACAGVVFSQMA